MGLGNLLQKIGDNFKAADFEIKPQTKIKTLCNNFKANFGLSLRVYKGQVIADGELTLAQLNKVSTKTDLKTKADALKIKASMKVGDAEKTFKDHFGVNVQIADFNNKKLCDNSLTIGEAARQK